MCQASRLSILLLSKEETRLGEVNAASGGEGRETGREESAFASRKKGDRRNGDAKNYTRDEKWLSSFPCESCSRCCFRCARAGNADAIMRILESETRSRETNTRAIFVRLAFDREGSRAENDTDASGEGNLP